MRLKDKVAIVTGGAGGIGRETCELFAAEGARLVIADIDEAGVTSFAEELKAKGYEGEAVAANVTDYKAAEKLAQTALGRFGRIDILVNIAGGSAGAFLKTKFSVFAESTRERWEEVVNLNFYGPLNCSRAVINQMIEQKSGKIVNVASTAGMIGQQKAAEYSAAKAGIIGFTKTLAKEVAPYNIHANCVSPGIIGTNRVLKMPDEVLRSWRDSIPFGRLGKPREIAGAILFLASGESDYITGANIPVSGGLTLGPKTY